METGSRQNSSEICCYQEKPRIKEVGEERDKWRFFMGNVITIWNVHEDDLVKTDYYCRRNGHNCKSAQATLNYGEERYPCIARGIKSRWNTAIHSNQARQTLGRVRGDLGSLWGEDEDSKDLHFFSEI